MHYLQKHILDILRYRDDVRYKDLLPSAIESSHLRYHLGQLEAAGYVGKRPDHGTYALTTAGKTIVDYLSTTGTHPKRTPKVITYTLFSHKDQLLLYKKDKEPYKDLVGLLGGKVHFGENPSQAAQREVREKLGWDIEVPSLAGIANIKISENSTPLTHAVAYVHSVSLDTVPLNLPRQVVITTLRQLDTHAAIPDLVPLLENIAAHKSPFVISLDLTV